MKRIMRLREVEQATGLKRSTIYLKMSRKEFPRSITLGPNSVGWLESEIQAWQETRIAARDGQVVS